MGPHRSANRAPTISSGSASASSRSVTASPPGTGTRLKPCGRPSGSSLPAWVHEPTQSSDQLSSWPAGRPRNVLVSEPPW